MDRAKQTNIIIEAERPLCYTLEGRTPVVAENLAEWAGWMEQTNRRVALTTIAGVRISTVFCGVDKGYASSPQYFETVEFTDEGPHVWNRYATWEEAEEGHARAVEFWAVGQDEDA